MAKSKKFGTFGGVFVPSVLTILGVIMYMRLPMIVGTAGLAATIGIIIVAHIISFTTGLSVSSIATDKKVEAGGTYFMISRSLGLPIGGTLGLALFVGLSFSVSLYLIGFSESFLGYWGLPTDINNIRLAGTCILVLVTALTLFSTSLAIKTQYFIMAAIVLSLISIFTGTHDLAPNPEAVIPESAVPLAVLFGIFFPAVTGFEAGVSMSGDLQNPKKSIPAGSIAAIVVGFVVYLGLAFFLTYTVDGSQLAGNPNILTDIARVPQLVAAGIWGATLSSALGSIMGAPRILQATAADGISPRFFAKGYGPSNEPRNALLLTFLIAEAGILIGELDVIARIVSVFFITTYGFLNISAAFEAWTGADYRPEFKVSGKVSMIGAIACTIVMIQLDLPAMIAAGIILGLLFFYLKRKQLQLETGDAWSGVWATLVRDGLHNLKKDKIHSRNWRPNIMLFSGSPERRQHLTALGTGISGNLGILSVFELNENREKPPGRGNSILDAGEGKSARFFLHRADCQNVFTGMEEISRNYGFSGVEPNTVLLGRSRTEKNKEAFIKSLQSFAAYGLNTVVLDFIPEAGFRKHNRIDVWWSGKGRNLAFAVNLLRYLTASRPWNKAEIRILAINKSQNDSENMYKMLRGVLDNYRLTASVKIIRNELDKEDEQTLIATHSQDAGLTVLEIPADHHRPESIFWKVNEGPDRLNGSALYIQAGTDFEEITFKPKTTVQFSETTVLTINELVARRFPEINHDMAVADNHIQKEDQLAFLQIFRPAVSDQIGMLEAVKHRAESLLRALEQLHKMPDSYRKKKAGAKLKSDNLFKINKLLAERAAADPFDLQKGTEEYLTLVRDSLKSYPRNLKINIKRSELESMNFKNRTARLRKQILLLANKRYGDRIDLNLPYFGLAREFVRVKRVVFLADLLKKFEDESLEFYAEIRAFLLTLSRPLTIAGRLPTETLIAEMNQLLQEAEPALENRKKYIASMQLRLAVNSRNMLNEMSLRLESLDFEHTLSRGKAQVALTAAESRIADFTENHERRIRASVNKIWLENSFNAGRQRLSERLDEFDRSLSDTLRRTLLAQIDELIAGAEKDGKELIRFKNFDSRFETEIKDRFERLNEYAADLAKTFPDSLEITSVDDAEGDTVFLPPARMAEYFFKTKFIGPSEEEFDLLDETFKRGVYGISDALNLLRFNFDNHRDEDESLEDSLKNCAQKMKAEKELLQEAVQVFCKRHSDFLKEAFEPLSLSALSESLKDFRSDLRNYQGRQALSGLDATMDKARQTVRLAAGKLFYGRSEGLLFARRLTEERSRTAKVGSVLDLRDKVSPSAEVLNKLPAYYISLFNGKSNIGKDFWISRPKEEALFARALQRCRSGSRGAIMIIGEKNSGKTAFVKSVLAKEFDLDRTFMVFPGMQICRNEDDLTALVAKAVGRQGDLRSILSSLPNDSVLAFHDLEMFWERAEKGDFLIRLIQDLINEYSHKCTFVLNTNPFAFRLMNRMSGLENYCTDIIRSEPFTAEELKELILTRHRSGGMTFSYTAGGDPLGTIETARLFHAYFMYGEGKPGSALTGWLTHIKALDGQNLIIRKPSVPSIAGIKNLPPELLMLLAHIVIHKRSDTARMARCGLFTEEAAASRTAVLVRAGLIKEKGGGIYTVDPYLSPFIEKALTEIEIL